MVVTTVTRLHFACRAHVDHGVDQATTNASAWSHAVQRHDLALVIDEAIGDQPDDSVAHFRQKTGKLGRSKQFPIDDLNVAAPFIEHDLFDGCSIRRINRPDAYHLSLCFAHVLDVARLIEWIIIAGLRFWQEPSSNPLR